jgi:hypothetical protein
MISLKQIKESGVAQAIGYSPDDTRFIAIVNRATERLMHSGQWFGSLRRIRLRVFDRRIALPGNVAAIERISLNGRAQKLFGEGYEFLEAGYGIEGDKPNPIYDCAASDVADAGTSPTSNELVCPTHISAMSEAVECEGAYVLVRGYDQYGHYLRSKDSDGCWYNGEELMLDDTRTSDPSTTLKKFYGQIISITKTETKGQVTVMANGMDGTAYILARMLPKQRTSTYRIYTLPRAPVGCDCDENVGVFPVISALVRMAFVPVYEDDDVLSLNCMPAIYDGILSEFHRPKEGGLIQSAAYYQSAIVALQQELQHYRGSGQMTPIAKWDDGTMGASGEFNLYGT